MGTGWKLMVTAETLAAVGVIARFVLPNEWGVNFTISAHRLIALPIRWFVPLLLISIAGMLSIAGLLSMFWSAAHVRIPSAGQ